MEKKFRWAWSGQEATLGEIQSQVGFGWHGIIERLVTDLLALGWDGEVAQVKEKFGLLRFYIGGGTDEIWKRIGMAESESATVCEDCGAPGRTYRDGWWRTLCEEHAKSR